MKKWGLFLLVVLAVFSVSTTTEASNWIRVGSDANSHTYFDLDSVSDGPNGSKEAERKILFEVPQFDQRSNKSHREFLSRDRYFSNKTRCMLSSVTFLTDGGVNQSTYTCSQTLQILPGMNMEKIWNYLFQ